MYTKAGSSTLLYLYAFIPTKEWEERNIPVSDGMEPPYKVRFLPFREVTAVVTDVSEENFSEEKLQKNVENMKWLQEKAYHHHQVMNQLHTLFTVLPLKFGTIHEKESRLEEVVDEQYEDILSSLVSLSQTEEWNVKIYADKQRFTSQVGDDHPDIQKKEEEIKQLSPGKQFFEKKKMKQLREQKAEEQMVSLCESMDQQMEKYYVDKELKKNWERKVTGRNDDMIWNSAYLVNVDDKEGFLTFIKKKGEEFEEKGMTLEATGPWPAYHFSNAKER